MRYMDMLKPKTQIIEEDGKKYEFTPGTGPESGLIVRNKITPEQPIAAPVKKNSKVIPVASPRG